MRYILALPLIRTAMRSIRVLRLVLLFAIAASVSAAYAQDEPVAPVLTQHNDNNRTGAYLTEHTFTPSSVATRGLTLAFSRPVDGSIDGQLLYVPNLSIGSRSVGAVFATTTNGTVYAYDANDAAASGTEKGLIWRTSLLGRDEPQNYGASYGVLSTPVIDRDTNALYVVTRSQEATGDQYWLCAINIATGEVARKVQVAAPGFAATWENQRPALLLDHGMIYIGFGVWGGEGPPGNHIYHGWVLRYNASTFALAGAFNATPGLHPGSGWDGGGGIWQGGGGLAADRNGNVYVLTGNGEYDPRTAEYGDSFVKLGSRSDGWGVVQSFAPPNDGTLNHCDLDLGSGGPLVIPGSERVVGGGKTGTLYALSSSNFALQPQTLTAGQDTYHVNQQPCHWEGGPHLHGSPAFWRDFVYVWAEQDVLRRFSIGSTGALDPASLAAGNVVAPKCNDTDAHPEDGSRPRSDQMCPMPGGTLSVSANGPTNGILWATLPNDNGGKPYYTPPGLPPPGQLLAYNAEKLVLLWRQNLPGLLGKWTPPTIADGKVFIPTSAANNARAASMLVYQLGPVPKQPPSVEASLFIDKAGRLDVAWLDLGDGSGWHLPQAISGPIAPAGAPISLARQTEVGLTGLFFDSNGRLNVAWLDVSDHHGWHAPAPISAGVGVAGGHVALAKQSDSVLTALFIDRTGTLNVAWDDLADQHGWHAPQPISRSVAAAGAPIVMEKQTSNVLTALFFDRSGRLNVAWLDLSEKSGWHQPQPISGAVATAGTNIAFGKQSASVLTALFVDSAGRLNVAWLDLNDSHGWHAPVPISGVVAPSGAAISMTNQTSTVLTALFVDSQSRLDVAWLDVADNQGWHAPVAISRPVTAAGASLVLAKQTDSVLTALLVDSEQRLSVAWLDLSEAVGWHPPQPISGAVAPIGAGIAMERQSP